jgi:hypothetical protein
VGRATCWGVSDLRGPLHALRTRTRIEASRSGSFRGVGTYTMHGASRKLLPLYVLIRGGEGRGTGDLMGTTPAVAQNRLEGKQQQRRPRR